MNTSFRVWCKNNKEWEKDLVVITQNGDLYEIKYRNGKLENYLLRKDTHIIQFDTGLIDMYGRKIYEGDIVIPRYNGFSAFEVKFEKGKYNVADFKTDSCEIIGNIFKNADSLED
jgi:hypothetical protein